MTIDFKPFLISIIYFSELKDNLVLTSSTSQSNNTLSLSKPPLSYASRNDSNRSYYRNTDHNYPTSHHQQQAPSSYSTYKRRMTNFQNNASSRYNGSHYKYNSSFRYHRSSETCDKENNTTTKPLFNEGMYNFFTFISPSIINSKLIIIIIKIVLFLYKLDEYTRITTPRQDVLFKKGYLSRPKKILPQNDLKTSSSGTMSVVSTEESMSSSTQSVSPEHCIPTPELYDSENQFIYPGFYDNNGVFYVNRKKNIITFITVFTLCIT